MSYPRDFVEHGVTVSSIPVAKNWFNSSSWYCESIRFACLQVNVKNDPSLPAPFAEQRWKSSKRGSHCRYSPDQHNWADRRWYPIRHPYITDPQKKPVLTAADICVQRLAFLALNCPMNRANTFQRSIFLQKNRVYFTSAWPGGLPHKKLFSIYGERACPTNGSDCGSLRSHNLTLFVGYHN